MPISPCKYDFPDSIDARTKQGELVSIRRLDTDSLELELLLRFSTTEMRVVPENHCVPVIDHFQPPDDFSITFIVTPYLRCPNKPNYDCADDFMEFVQQMFEVCYLRLDFGVPVLLIIENYLTLTVYQGISFFHAHGVVNV